jgi:hypothetical protein
MVWDHRLCGTGSEPALSEVEGTRSGGAPHRFGFGVAVRLRPCGPPDRVRDSVPHSLGSHTRPGPTRFTYIGLASSVGGASGAP